LDELLNEVVVMQRDDPAVADGLRELIARDRDAKIGRGNRNVHVCAISLDGAIPIVRCPWCDANCGVVGADSRGCLQRSRTMIHDTRESSAKRIRS